MENTGKWSLISLIAKPLLIIHSVSLVNMLSISVEVFSVILVGLLISGENPNA